LPLVLIYSKNLAGISRLPLSSKFLKEAARSSLERDCPMISNRPPLLVQSQLPSISAPLLKNMACKYMRFSYIAIILLEPCFRPVVLHSDHCAKKLLPWFDGMLAANEKYFKEHQEPLFSSHMLDLSEESKEENIKICVEYFKRLAPLGIWLEMEIGITGGEEDGVDNTGVDNSALYTQPEDVWDVYDALSKISPNFSIAAAFGNVHGVYKPGNVKLHPELLQKHQLHAEEKLSGKKKPLLVLSYLPLSCL
jgi:fructose-bisphosphate aldolase class II